PFAAPDLLEQGGAINIIRHIKGKLPYAVIVKNDEEMKIMDALKNQKITELKNNVDRVSDALQHMDESQRNDPGWTPDSLRTTLTPELFDKNLDSLKKLTQELSVLSRLELRSNENKQALSSLRPEKDKLYIIGHGGAGMDVLAADQHMAQGKISAKTLALDLLEGGLTPLFDDIRVTACYSADAIKPTDFKEATLEISAQPVSQNKLKSFANTLSDELSDKGFSKVKVSGYHGAGVTYSQEENHLRRLNGVTDMRRSAVRRTF
ncbi:hypothetical protein ACR9GP_26095, partial [Enterobacter ludwigii]